MGAVVDGVTVGDTFSVASVVSVNRLTLSAGFNPIASTSVNSVQYTIVSQQVVKVSYLYNPISIDIGSQVLLADGLSRGVRPGRGAFTITDLPLVLITSIYQVDPDTGEVIGNALQPPGGYGAGGYGTGGYGVGNAGDYIIYVNVPNARYSMFEDSMIIFNEDALSNSYQVNYLFVPELQGIHTITRDDTERVTGADVLVKSFIPCFVDIPIVIRPDTTNADLPTDAELATGVSSLVEATTASTGLDATAIEVYLQGRVSCRCRRRSL